MEHQSAHVQRGTSGHLLGVAVVEPIRDRISRQAAALARALLPEGHPVGRRQTCRKQDRQCSTVRGTYNTKERVDAI